MGARPWLVRTQVGYAEMLVTRRRRGDRGRARELLRAAGATAAALGMVPVAARVAELEAGGGRAVRLRA
jgi:hypothetical protein